MHVIIQPYQRDKEGYPVIQAAIVEDEKEARVYLRDNLVRAFAERNRNLAVDLFADGQEFFSMFEKHYHYDVLFLDIEMSGLSGFEICRRVREIKPDMLVVFISGREELVFQSFEVQPFRFIRKGSFSQQCSALADAVIEELERRAEKIISVTEPLSHDIYSFDIRKISYIEASNKDCLINTTAGETRIKCKFSQLEELLRNEPFLKVHRSYLVNCSYIFYIGKTSLSLTTGVEIPLSRGRAEEIKAAYMRYIAN